MNKALHTKVYFCDQEGASKLINDPFFVEIEEFDNMTFEVSLIINEKYRYHFTHVPSVQKCCEIT